MGKQRGEVSAAGIALRTACLGTDLYNRGTYTPVLSYLRKQLFVRPAVSPHFYTVCVRPFVRLSRFRPTRLCVFARLSGRHVFDPRQKQKARIAC